MILHSRNSLASCLLFLFSASALAQSTPATPNRPKVGLVLEGGGALGLTHIGVIQWLEEHRIPVNYVAGTSMGGLVGGVYATGRNASEVREVVEGIDWDTVIGGQIPFDDLSYRRKQDSRDFPGRVEFGMRRGVEAPSGFNTGQHVSFILDRLSLPYSQLNSFDDLPIPFACLATDLSTNSEHVFRSGSLAVALRSTMSLPGIFTPVRSGTHLYVDGGLLNNFPVNVAKDMGAEYTIGVYLEAAPVKSDASLSSIGVLSQSISVVVEANVNKSLKELDLVISVPVAKYSSMDYKKADELIKIGYDAAAASSEKLLKLSVDEATWDEYIATRNARRSRAITVPQFLEVNGVSKDAANDIAKDLSGYLGKPLDSNQLAADILRIEGSGGLSSINYSLVEREGKTGLLIQAEPKPYAPPMVRPLIYIDGADFNTVYFTMGARFTFVDFGGYRRELRSDVLIGSQYKLSAEYYRPFSAKSRWFIAPQVDLDSQQFPLYDKNTVLAVYRNRKVLGGLDLGYTFGRTSELRAGYEGGYEKMVLDIGNSTALPTVSGATGDAKLQFSLTTLDDPVIPHNGEGIEFYTKYFTVNPGAPEGFPVSEMQSKNFFKISRRNAVFLNASGGSTFGFKAGVPMFQLGGIRRLSAFGTNELLTNQYVVGQAGFLRTLTYLPAIIGSSIDLLGAFEVGKTYRLPNGPKPPNVPGDIMGALVLNTRFGPLAVGGAVGDYGHAKMFFQIGKIF